MTGLILRDRADIGPGAVHVPGWLTAAEQRRLAAACREWARPPAGLRATRPGTGGPAAGLAGGGRLNITLRESGLDAAGA